MRSLAIVLALAAAAGGTAPAFAQDSSNADVLAAVDAFMAGLNSKNPEAMAEVVIEGAIVASVREGEDGDRTRVRSMQSTIDALTSEQSDFREVYWDPTVLINGPIAVVWAPYSFDANATRTHCGIDVFNLFRLDGKWKITSVQYTVEPEGCPAGR